MSKWPEWISPDGRVRLINADAADVLRAWPFWRIDQVLTDPPYGNNYSTGRRLGIYRPSTRITGDIISEPLLNDVASALEPLLNDVASIYWFAAPDRLDMVLPILRRWEVVNVLAWDKGNCTAGDLECSYGKQWESIVYAVTEKHPLLGGRDRDVIRINRGNTCEYVHPTQKPVALMDYLIRRHNAETICDPFGGSCTTAVAAIRAERQCVCIERERQYWLAGIERCQREYERTALIEPQRMRPTQRELLEVGGPD